MFFLTNYHFDRLGRNHQSDTTIPHVGSIDVITDSLGHVIQSLSFDAWGARRNATRWQSMDEALTRAGFSTFAAPLNTTVLSHITTCGFTGHEMLDDVGIIHMNGRIYDPKLGRFLQADPFIQAPTKSQSFNRYSYVINNPLSYTDPSGFLFGKFGKFIKKYWKPIAAIIVTVVTYGYASGPAAAWAAGAGYSATTGAVAAGAIAGAAGGFVGGALQTGSLRGALRGALFGWDTEARLGILGKVYGMNSMAVFHDYWMADAGIQNSLLLGATIIPAAYINYIGVGGDYYRNLYGNLDK